VTELSARNFGLLIAYVLPGFVALWGLSYASEPIRQWLQGAGQGGPTVGGVLYIFLSSIAAGMTASVVRWAILDTVLHHTGVPRPALDFSRLNDHLAAFDRLIEWHYQYYQFYGNTLIAALVAYPMWRAMGGVAGVWAGSWGTDIGFIALEGVFAAGARDALRNFYSRTGLLLGQTQETSHDERIGTSRNDEERTRQADAPTAIDSGEADDGSGWTAGAGPEADE
jgi:hypothetical protein